MNKNESYVLMAYYGEWDIYVKLLGVFSSMEKAEEAKIEYEKVVNDYMAKNPFPDFEEMYTTPSDEDEIAYNTWRYGENKQLVDYTNSEIYKFELNQLVKV